LAPKVPETWLALVKYLAAAKRGPDAEKVIEQAGRQLPAEQRSLTLGSCFEAIGQVDRAGQEYQQAQKAQPANSAVLKAVARFYLRTGLTNEAEQLLRRLLSKAGSGDSHPAGSDSNWVRHQLALVLAHRSEYREALALLGLEFNKTGNIVELTIHSSPEDLRIRAQILALLDSRSSRERAIAYLDELNRMHALTAEDQFLLARLYEANGSQEKARITIRGLASSFNSNPAYLAYYSRCLLNHHDLDDADRFIDQLEQLEKARKVETGAFGSTELRVQLLESRGENRKALALLETQARQPSAGPSVIITLISSLARQKRWTDALELADRAWDHCPPEAIGGISVALLRDWSGMTQPKEEFFARIERRLRTAMQANPHSANIPLQLADLLQIRNQLNEAESLYRQIVSQHGRNVMALNNLAWLLALKPEKAQEALVHINRAIEVGGPLPHLLDTRALVNLTLGQSGPAIADLEQALTESPNSPNGFRYFHLARAYRLSGNTEAAGQAFRKAAEYGLELDQLHPIERLAYREMVKDYELK
jgi:tetratricopeptide (TPR) repeat protein